MLGDNRKARFLYVIEDSLECGIELVGTEVKSVKSSHFDFSDSFAEVREGELWLRNFSITPYRGAGVFNHYLERTRRLLAHKKEILRLEKRVNEKGCTLVPLRLYLSNGRVKVLLGLCRGKKLADKRETIKKRDLQRDLERQVRF